MSNHQKGFVLILLLIAVLVLGAIGGVYYYFGVKSNISSSAPEPSTSQPEKNSQSSDSVINNKFIRVKLREGANPKEYAKRNSIKLENPTVTGNYYVEIPQGETVLQLTTRLSKDSDTFDASFIIESKPL